MRVKLHFFIALVLLITTSPVFAQISQPFGGDDTIQVTPNIVAASTASLDVFANCAQTTSLLMPGTQHSVSGAGPVILKLKNPLASGQSICVVETFNGTVAPPINFTAITEDPAERTLAGLTGTLSIDPVTAGSNSLSIRAIVPQAGNTASIHIYSSCPPAAGASALDAPGITNTVDQSGNEVVVKLAGPTKSKDTLCAVETYSGASGAAPAISSPITVTDVVRAATPPKGLNAKTALANVLFAGGVTVSAGASTNAGANFNLDIDFDQPVFNPQKNGVDPVPIDSWFWLSGYVRLASIAQPGAISSSTSLTTYVSPAIDTSPANLVQSGEMLLSMDLGAKGHIGADQAPLKVLGTFAVGAITPLSSAPSTPTVYVVSQPLYNYYTSSSFTDIVSKNAVTGACGTTYSTTAPCYIVFNPQERTSFFRNWSAGLKVKNYYYDNQNGNDDLPFPGITTLTFGQNEYVTGGAMSGYVLHVGSVEPLPSGVAQSLAGSLYVFGSTDIVVRRNVANGGAPQFSLATAPSNIAASASNVAQVSIAQPNRDRYRFGIELDLTKLLSLMKKSD